MNYFARPKKPRPAPPSAQRDGPSPQPAALPDHPMPDLNGTLLALMGLALTAVLSNGDHGSTIARAASFGTLLSILVSVALDLRLGGLRNLIRADLMAMTAFYFLTLFEFLYPQPQFDSMASAQSTHQAVLCVLLGFAGLFVGRHLIHPARQPFVNTLQREIPPRWVLVIFWSCMVVGYAHMVIAVDFNFYDLITCMMNPRFSQPWQRARLGDWKALLVELGLFIYLIPPLGGIIIARRQRYGRMALVLFTLALALTFFYGITSGTRSIFAAYLITFLIGYAFALPFADRKELVFLCIGSGVLMVTISALMLKIRDMGLTTYLAETADPVAIADKSYFVDYNLHNICVLTDFFPTKMDYLGWEIPYQAIIRPIPRAIWPGKPEGLSTSIEEVIGAEGWTVSATFAGEAYMSAGFLGVGIIAVFFGAFTGWWSHLASPRNSEMGILIYASGFFATVISMRSMFVMTTALLPTVAALVIGTYAVRLLATQGQKLLALATLRGKQRRFAPQARPAPPARPPTRPAR